MELAILREKQIKGGSRKKKLDLIEKVNQNWQDLYDNIIELDGYAPDDRSP
jgi:putative endonuclease